MKPLKNALAAVAALFAFIATIDVGGILPLLSPHLPAGTILLIASLPSAAAFIVHSTNAFSDWLESVGAEVDRFFPPDEEPPQPPTGRTSIAVIALLSLACLALPSCAGWDVVIRSPYGDASSHDGGPVIVHPRPDPIVIPFRSSK